jgi:hypothetical protein
MNNSVSDRRVTWGCGVTLEQAGQRSSNPE